jgi:hypothetical protein
VRSDPPIRYAAGGQRYDPRTAGELVGRAAVCRKLTEFNAFFAF